MTILILDQDQRQVDLEKLRVGEAQPDPVCHVCPEKATKRLTIEVSARDDNKFQLSPVDVFVFHFCDEHAFPYVEYKLSPLGRD